eukprot:TRINITY_DN3651_c0_g1_i17.p1 TRINITY_DN3651_c0_g1~~TRINITY_DN3651_c0_g1_i17.p1  ORF type:complete len:413 (-),score=58.27 TRINITY_DN3651_c0_g1_i17:105-1343(-)
MYARSNQDVKNYSSSQKCQLLLDTSLGQLINAGFRKWRILVGFEPVLRRLEKKEINWISTFYLSMLTFNFVLYWFSYWTEAGSFDVFSSSSFSMLFAFLFLELTRRTDPGYIKSIDHDFSLTPSAKTYAPVCDACQAVRYLRSKHDMQVNKCIYRYDHFDKLLKYPIGANNHRFYFFSIFFTSVNTFMIWWHVYDGLNWAWNDGNYFWITLFGVTWVVTLFVWMHVSTLYFFDEIIRILSNVTKYELEFPGKHVEYLSLLPYYLNTFDLGWKANFLNLLTGFKSESQNWKSPQWDQTTESFFKSFMKEHGIENASVEVTGEKLSHDTTDLVYEGRNKGKVVLDKHKDDHDHDHDHDNHDLNDNNITDEDFIMQWVTEGAGVGTDVVIPMTNNVVLSKATEEFLQIWGSNPKP